MEVSVLKDLKNVWKRISVIAVMFLLYCMFALMVLADENEVVITEEMAVLSLEAPKENDQVRLYTYVIKDAENREIGRVELRYGINTREKRLWIVSGGSQYFDRITKFNIIGRHTIEIPLDIWNSYFQEGVAYTYDVSYEVLEPINPIKSIEWTEKGGFRIEWNADKNINDKVYDIRIYLDDKFISNFQFNRSKEEESDQYVDYGTSNINESGTYTAFITASGKTKTIGDSKQIQTKTPFQYTRPSDSVEKVKEIRWREKNGETIPTIIEWDEVGAKKYSVHLEVYENGEWRAGYGRSVNGSGVTDKPLQLDWSKQGYWSDLKEWAKKENVNFEISIRPYSYDITKIANGDETRQKEYKIYDKVSEVTEKLADTTVESILEDVDKAGIESVAIAMQTDEQFLEKMKKLEEEYISANSNIEVKQNNEYPELFGDIKVVGAAMNAVSGGAVTLNLSKVSKEKEINDFLYTNAIQVDIDLVGDVCDKIKNEKVLASPITVTMYPPKEIELSKLVILHHHGNEVERIYPVFRADGKITFSVTKFSTFIFAEMVSHAEDSDTTESEKPSNPKEPQDDDDDDDDRSSGSKYISASSTGVQAYGTGKRFVKSDGSIAKSEWVKKDEKWYYAGADGLLKTGWYQNAAGVWYYLQNNCEMATNWQLINDKWYYLDSTNGDMKTSWLQTKDGKWYYLDPKNGDMAEGWKFVNGKWYYLNPVSGDMATGWKQVNGKWYFLTKNGDCLLDTVTPDGYKVNKDGAWIQ